MNKVSASPLSLRDLADVAGGLNEFAHRTDLGDSGLMNHGLSLGVLGVHGPGVGAVGGGGLGGIGAGGLGVPGVGAVSGGGLSDGGLVSLNVFHGSLGSPGAGAASGDGGGAGAGNGTGGGLGGLGVLGGIGASGTHGVINPALIHAWEGAPGAHGSAGNVPGGIGAGTAPGAFGPGGANNGLFPNGAGGSPSASGFGAGGPHVGWGDGHMNPMNGNPLNGTSANGPNGYGASGVSNDANMAGGAYGIATQSFEIRNWGDPHINININGQELGQIDEMASLNNFQVFHNTVGGATSISTETTEGGGATWNKEIDIHGGNWAVSASNADMDGDVDVMIQDAYGTHELAEGQSVRQMDGTVLTNQGGKLIVEQHLADGGHVTTEIEVNGANYLDMKSTGQGNAGLGGYVVDKFDDNHQVQQNVGPAQTTTNPLNTVGWG